MLLTCEEMRRAEAKVFATGVSAEILMDKAGLGIADAVRQFFPQPARLLIFAGKGHNAGDAFVAAEHLLGDGWRVEVRLSSGGDELKRLTAKKFEKIAESVTIEPLGADLASTPGATIIMDGLLGIGASGALRGAIKDACIAANRLRIRHHAATVAIDIPTGLDGDTGEADPDAIVADFTCTAAAAKTGLVADAAINHVGRLVLVPLAELEPPPDGTSPRVADARLVRSLLPLRSFDTHKGQAGRVGIIAGSVGLQGAARLCASAAVRSGAGLVSLFAPKDVWSQLAVACPPEVMVQPLDDLEALAEMPMNAWAIGPGLGSDVSPELVEFMLRQTAPTVIDADGLNAISKRGASCLDRCKGPRLLTPHPGEMARLDGALPSTRAEQAESFAARFPSVSLLLKGARTVVATTGHPTTFNTTGNPGMASGGMGDALTGVCVALLGQGLAPHDAGVVGSWLLGRAAELAIYEGVQSSESVCASDLIALIGNAFRNAREGCL
jgi:hydroxyethylthiazole kinase-like uncharacterized protein yjeF